MAVARRFILIQTESHLYRIEDVSPSAASSVL
jgi:hypothetical protein